MRTLSPVIRRGTIVIVHNLRNRLFLPEYGLCDVPLMVSVADITKRPYLQRSIRDRGLKAYLGVQGPVLVDSGGFSFMASSNSTITVESLIALYRMLDADVLTALDVPPALEDTSAARAKKWRATLTNLDKMLAGLSDDRLMPVIHGRDLLEITNACREVRKRTERPHMIALGGMVPFLRGLMSRERFSYRLRSGAVASGADFVADALSICRSEFPRSRLHILGVGSPTTAIALLALGADSVDSLAWRRAAGYGTIFLAGCAERIVSSRTRRRLSRPFLSTADLRLLQSCLCPVCSRYSALRGKLRALGKSYVLRGVHNVWTLMAEEAALRAARAAGTLGAFLNSRIHGRHRFSGPVLKHFEFP
jgi:tRNA-guanine family transglycosylase